VIGNQTAGMAKHIESAQLLLKGSQDGIPVDVIDKDGGLDAKQKSRHF
jgi:hypothetical protein